MSDNEIGQIIAGILVATSPFWLIVLFKLSIVIVPLGIVGILLVWFWKWLSGDLRVVEANPSREAQDLFIQHKRILESGRLGLEIELKMLEERRKARITSVPSVFWYADHYRDIGDIDLSCYIEEERIKIKYGKPSELSGWLAKS